MRAIASLFWFGGRIGRTTFLIRLAVLFAVPLAVHAICPDAMDEPGDPLLEALQALVVAAYVWCVWVNSAKRWHDVDRSALYTALMIVPTVGIVANLALNAFIGGTPGPNRFGDPPR